MKNIKKSKKRKWLKPILFVFILISIFIAVVIIYLLSNLDLIVKRTIEKYGSQTTLTKVRVKDVDISLKDSSCQITNFTISNLKGFKKKKIFFINKIHIDFDLLSLKDDEIILKKIIIINPEVFVEINKKNKNNMVLLNHNLSKTSKIASNNSSINEKEPRLYIRYMLIKGGEISVLVTPLKNKSYLIKLPSFKMLNLRGTSTEITNQILKKIIKKTQKEIRKSGIKFLKDKYGNQVKKELQKQKENILNKLQEGLKI